jgi:hypothetical protein
MNRWLKGSVAGLVLGASAVGLTTVAAVATPSDPPRPPWVRIDGTTDHSKLPAKIRIVDRNGNIVRDSQGREVLVSTRPGDGPPPTVTSRRSYRDADGVPTEELGVEPVRPADQFGR